LVLLLVVLVDTILNREILEEEIKKVKFLLKILWNL